MNKWRIATGHTNTQIKNMRSTQQNRQMVSSVVYITVNILIAVFYPGQAALWLYNLRRPKMTYTYKESRYK
jgi:hypothetical protein